MDGWVSEHIRKKTMKLAIKTVLLCAALLAAALPTSAALQLRLSDGLGAVVTVTDGDALDVNPSPGAVSYSGPVGVNWLTTISTGGSKPILGSALFPHLDLNTFEVNSVSGGTLTIELTDTGFTGAGPGFVSTGGTTAGQVTYKVFSDNSNAAFGKASLEDVLGPFSGGVFSQNSAALVSGTAPYSLTLEITVNHVGLGRTGLDAELAVTPQPLTNCVQKAEPLAPCSTSTNHHALFMRGIGIDFVFNPIPGTFIENPDGTASIQGNLVSVVDPTKSFALDLQLSGRTDIAPPGSPRKQFLPCAYKPVGPIDITTFYYYPNFTGTLIGGGSLAGAKLTIGPVMGLAFQVGVGANGKNYNFGASSWFLWTVNMQPNSGPALPVTGQGDFNLDIFDCAKQPPVPPAAAKASISGSVVNDSNLDGSLSGEAGLSGWTVTLKSGSTVVDTKTTGANGDYAFNNLDAGTYTVTVTPKSDYKQTVDPDGSKDNKCSVTLTAGQSKALGGFGYAPPAAPTNLSDYSGNAKVKLSWSSVSGATSYTINRSSTKGGPYVDVKTGVTGTSYTDTSLANGTVYFYVVCALKNAVASLPSAEVSSIPSAGVTSPWSTKDIGSVGDAGAASAAGGIFTVIGSGNYIHGTSDEFRYAYQSANGDCTIVARVVDVQNTDQFAKGGVMIRESLNANARHASVFLTPADGVAFANRTSSGGATANTFAPVVVLPAQWVKVVRAGSTFSGYSSPDGVNWTLLGTQTISMASSVYIGLAVNGHNDGVLCTVNFDNVTATP